VSGRAGSARAARGVLVAGLALAAACGTPGPRATRGTEPAAHPARARSGAGATARGEPVSTGAAPHARSPAPPAAASAGPPVPAYDPELGLLTVFVQPDAGPAARSFADDVLPGLRALGADLGVALHVADVARGAPAEVAITPLLVFTNHRGRSIYQGRSHDLERIRTFLRTARRVPQADVPLVRDDLVAHRDGRARITGALEVAPITGTPPEGFEAEAFAPRARAAMVAGLRRLRPAGPLALRRADRTFYLDVYPWRSPDGTLHVSAALFSPFHCKEPIWRTDPDAPFTGPDDELDALIGRAAAALEQALFERIARSRIGDAFEPVPASTPQLDWEALGLGLPAPPQKTGSAAPADVAIPATWTLASPGPHEAPALQFHFAPPLEAYAGEVTSLRGTLRLGEDGRLAAARGRVEADVASVTTGYADLDRTLAGPMMLDARAHPVATLEIDAVAAEAPGVPTFGRAVRADVDARFTLKGTTVPVAMVALVEPLLTVDGEVRLHVSGRFEIRIAEPFGLQGPDGPSPANDTVVLDVDALWEPAGT